MPLYCRIVIHACATLALVGCGKFDPSAQVSRASKTGGASVAESGKPATSSSAPSNPPLDALYAKILNRKPIQREIIQYAKLAASPSTVGQVADALLHGSEHGIATLSQITELLFKRPPNGDEITFFSASADHRTLLATLLASPEFAARAQHEASTGSPEGNVCALAFKVLFARDATALEVRQCLRGWSDFGVAALMLGLSVTPEYTNRLTTQTVQTYAGRAPSTGELADYGARVRNQRVETAFAAFLVDKVIPH